MSVKSSPSIRDTGDVQPGKPLWKSIKLKTLLLVFLMVAPLVILGTAGTLYYQGVIKQNINDDTLNQAKTIAAMTPEYMNTSQLYLQSIADRPLVIKAMEDNDRPFLHSMAVYANQTNRIDGVFITDSKGIIIESTPGLANLIDSNLSDHAYVGSVIRTGYPVMGNAEPGVSRMLDVPIGVPVKDGDGTVIGVLVGKVSLYEYEKMLVDKFIKPQQILYMVNETGHVILHTNPEYAMAMSDFTAVPSVQHVLRGESGVFDYYNPIENESRMGAYVPVEPMGWGVIVALPADVAYQPVWDATWMAAGIIALFSLIAMGLGLYIGNGITTPISKMSQATTIAFKTDDYQKLLPLKREDEIGDLARSFNEMVDTVKKEEIERLRAEEELRGSEVNLAKAQSMAHLGFWVWDVDKDVLTWSDETYRVLGLQPGKLTPNNNIFMGFVHPEDRDKVAKAVREALDGTRPYSVEWRALKEDGSISYMYSQGEVEWTNGRPSRMMGTILDITERKLAEERSEAAKAQAELYLDLMGHDINNMNMIAMGYLEMARDLPAGPEKDELIEKPIEVLQRSTRLIKNVRKLQTVQEGMFQYRDVDACEILVDVHRAFGAVPNKIITLNMNGCKRCHVRANELLHDVFVNLVSNAIKHTGDRADIDIVLNVVKDNSGQYCRVSVEDNGPGIPDDLKVVIFNRMLKGTKKAKGMGLGLFIVKSLVDSYGGKVWVEDRVHGDHTKGARFVVMLPTAM